jgi:hypothetical protein
MAQRWSKSGLLVGGIKSATTYQSPATLCTKLPQVLNQRTVANLLCPHYNPADSGFGVLHFPLIT